MINNNFTYYNNSSSSNQDPNCDQSIWKSTYSTPIESTGSASWSNQEFPVYNNNKYNYYQQQQQHQFTNYSSSYELKLDNNNHHQGEEDNDDDGGEEEKNENNSNSNETVALNQMNNLPTYLNTQKIVSNSSKLNYRDDQLILLNSIYIEFKYPNSVQKTIIAKRIGITRDQIKVIEIFFFFSFFFIYYEIDWF